MLNGPWFISSMLERMFKGFFFRCCIENFKTLKFYLQAKVATNKTFNKENLVYFRKHHLVLVVLVRALARELCQQHQTLFCVEFGQHDLLKRLEQDAEAEENVHSDFLFLPVIGRHVFLVVFCLLSDCLRAAYLLCRWEPWFLLWWEHSLKKLVLGSIMKDYLIDFSSFPLSPWPQVPWE